MLLLSQGLYAELLDTDVGVSVVLPGGMDTNITASSGVETPAGVRAEDSKIPVTSAEDAAMRLVDGIEHNELFVHIGRQSTAMHLVQRIAPKQATHLITRQTEELLD